MDLKAVQRPFKERYRSDPESSRITLRARGGRTETPLSCSVDIGRAVYEAQAHAGTGGPGTGACSGDLLLGALAACAQITCQLVAEALGISASRIEVAVEGDLDLRGTLGVSKEVPVGFEHIRVRFDVDAPERLGGPAANPAREDRAVLRRFPDAREASPHRHRLGGSRRMKALAAASAVLRSRPRPRPRSPRTAAARCTRRRSSSASSSTRT